MSNQEFARSFFEAFTIFSTYSQIGRIASEKDVIYAGPSPVEVNKSDINRLNNLGWWADTQLDCFVFFINQKR